MQNSTDMIVSVHMLIKIFHASGSKDAGYRTACVGKMHFRPTYLDIGFDKMILAEQNGEGLF